MKINEALVLQKIVRERVNSLTELRNSSSKTERYLLDSQKEKVVEPTYNAKSVDAKIVELQRFLLSVDTRIKASNAVTDIEINANVEQLLAPVE